jgi:hypothetical protein
MPVKRTALVLLLTISTIASAADLTRCGKDQFGNIVCLDNDGVLRNMTGASASDYSTQSTSGVPVTESRAERDKLNERLRCGTDPFGNKVCR